ncbi:alanine racemase [Sunxiuqinia rutila]|uniref:alanine racemase n=1 Tax=Sunxiuqinia rutila TaxID=1397841 RepID=UPI003D35BE6A
MAFITLDTQKLKKNYDYLEKLLSDNGITWAVVSKLLCGNKRYLEEVINLGVKQLCDSRVSNLKMIKSISDEIETIYIKPPPKHSIDKIVRYADISFNTEIETITRLSKEAQKQDKIHKVIIMIETGELREGVLQEDFLDFYDAVFKLPNIEVVGIGTNLTCMYGILPSHDKLVQLCLYEQLIEAKFNKEIEYVSGGASVTVPLIFQGLLPKGINHFRIGETFFLGTDVYNNVTFDQMENDTFQLYAEIIELTEKRMRPIGELGKNLLGETVIFEDTDQAATSHRALIDLGLLDIDENHIKLKNRNHKIVGASSDMLVVDLGKNEENYQVGSLLEFEMDYMGVLRIMNSKYIEKRIKAE